MWESAHLGGNDEVVSLPAVLFNGLAHDLFALAGGVDLGAVEKVDARVVGGLHAGIGALCGKLAYTAQLGQLPLLKTNPPIHTAINVAAIGQPSTEGNGRHLEARLSEKAVLHRRKIFRLGHVVVDGGGWYTEQDV